MLCLHFPARRKSTSNLAQQCPQKCVKAYHRMLTFSVAWYTSTLHRNIYLGFSQLFPAEVVFNGRVRRIGAHHCLVPSLGARRRPPHLCLPFCSNSSCLLQTTSCDASVAGTAWATTTMHMLPKLLHEGKTAATRARSCGHHDSLQFFILFSLWADNLFITVTAFSLHGSISVVAA